MTLSLTESKEEFRGLLLQFLWRQWSAIGVAGHAKADDPWVVDPEALLAFSCTMARHDPRLFDEVLDWLTVNNRFVSVQRLKMIMDREGFKGGLVLSAIAKVLAQHGPAAKWTRLATSSAVPAPAQPLFRLGGDTPAPLLGAPDPIFAAHGLLREPLALRGLSNDFPPYDRASLQLRLRALFGVNARADIMLYLLLDRGNAREIARQLFWFHRTVQDALSEMTRSGLIMSRRLGRERRYFLRGQEDWRGLLGQPETQWICWPPLLAGLEAIWLTIQSDTFASLTPMLQMSELRQLMRQEVAEKFLRSGLEFPFPDEEKLSGLTYLSALLGAVRRMLG